MSTSGGARVAAVGHARLTRSLGLGCSALLLFLFYFGVSTGFRFGAWPTSSCGRIFDAQAAALLEGRMAIEREVLGAEAFERDGLSYTYFGILPALLRMPLLAHSAHEWTAPSCALAATIASLCLLLSLRTAMDQAGRAVALRLTAIVLGVTYIVSGPQFELTAKPTVYVEAILWGYAFICAFIWRALAVPVGAAVRSHFALLGALAVAALLARVTAGLALYLAWGLMATSLLWRAGPESPLARARPLLPGALVLALGVVVVGGVNHARWGNPLVFADLALNVTYANSPDRTARLAAYGSFEAERIRHAFAYYFAPQHFRAARRDGPHAADIRRLFDNAEGPPANQLLTKLAWWLLAGGAALAAVARRAPHPMHRHGGIALAAAFTVPPLVMLSYGYLAFRFGAEFVPLALAGSLAGVTLFGSVIPTTRRPKLAAALLAAVVCGGAFVQVWTGWRATAAYVASDYTDNVCD